MNYDALNVAKQMTLGSGASVASEMAPAAQTHEVPMTLTEKQELQTLSQIIITWRELNNEVSQLREQVREKTKRQKALEEMILRIMKKHNIGALDLKGSGARLLYRRQTQKESLSGKNLTALLAAALKSEEAAANAIKYIAENRGSKVRESLLYEKE